MISLELRRIEFNLLAALIATPQAWDRVGNILEAKHFSEEGGKIYDAIGALILSGYPVSVDTVVVQLGRKHGNDFAQHFFKEKIRTAVPGDVLALARLIRGEYALRMIRAVGVRLQEVDCPADDAASALVEAAELIQKLQDELPCLDTIQPLEAVLTIAIDVLQDAELALPSEVAPLSLNASLTAHLRPGHLVGLCGPDSVGKTTLATQLFGQVVKADAPAVFFTMEMTAQEIVQLLLAEAGDIRRETLGTGALTDVEWSSFTGAVEGLRSLGAYLDEEPTQTLAGLTAKIGRIKRQNGGLALAVIDNLTQLSHGSGLSSEGVVIALKKLARQYACCILLLAHDDEPLRNSADTILSLRREDAGHTLGLSKFRRGLCNDRHAHALQFDGSKARFSSSVDTKTETCVG